MGGILNLYGDSWREQNQEDSRIGVPYLLLSHCKKCEFHQVLMDKKTVEKTPILRTNLRNLNDPDNLKSFKAKTPTKGKKDVSDHIVPSLPQPPTSLAQFLLKESPEDSY